ncbi:M23 family metallopeptidase [Flavicella sp.]|uniref:M23 family metallopeptidase n=1 Tax=Flavicella sp. TaxID=2957742 RepID=UPI0030190379
MKKTIFTLFTIVLLVNYTVAQEKYPQDYFRNPLGIPMILSGTFGELRTSHFHSGIDLKTQQKEGLKVYTAAEGYVSRIKISNWGYGKALYITHPNGYTTVYAHLKNFNKTIEKYIHSYQYKKEKEEIQLFPEKSELLIEKDEIIAYSGSTGGFIAPHLHFEIRNTKTAKIINPMHFGFIPPDSKAPVINHVRAYMFNDSSHVNSSNIEIPINFKQDRTGVYQTDRINAYGKIGFAINTFDRLDGALNKNGIYKLEMFVNGKKTFEHKVETFSFDESKYINLHIDYSFYAEHKRKYQKTYIHPENKLSTYLRTKEKGYLQIEDKLNYQVVIKVTDFVGNLSELTIPIIGKKMIPKIKKEKSKTAFYIDKEQSKEITIETVKIYFPKNSFYDSSYLDISLKDNLLKVHTPNIPLNKSYRISFNVKNLSKEQRDKMYIARVVNNKYYNYCNTVKTDSTFMTTTKKLGNYKLHSDMEPPVISHCSFYKNQNLSNNRFFNIRVIDKTSGLKEYRGEIDGKWVRMELNVKTNTLTFDFNDLELKKGKHTFTLVAMDNVGNTSSFTSLFLLK